MDKLDKYERRITAYKSRHARLQKELQSGVKALRRKEIYNQQSYIEGAITRVEAMIKLTESNK